MASRAARAATVPVSGKTLLMLLRRGISVLSIATNTRLARSNRRDPAAFNRIRFEPRQRAAIMRAEEHPRAQADSRILVWLLWFRRRGAALGGRLKRRRPWLRGLPLTEGTGRGAIYRSVDGARTTAGPASALTTGLSFVELEARLHARSGRGVCRDQTCGTVLCASHLYRSSANAFGSRVRM